jgi:hypothetical protein
VFYQISLDGIPSGGGTVSPASGTFYPKNFVLNISATPNNGYQFVNWTGDPVANANSASTTITMDAPHTVHANFTNLPTNLSATNTGKSGAQNARLWSYNIGNAGPGAASAVQVTGFTLTQVFGAACTPVVATALPIQLGDLAPGSSAPTSFTINFTGCALNARFTLTMTVSANAGGTTLSRQWFNQFQ